MDFIVVSDEALNDQGFRVLSSGIDIKTRFESNPIMHYAHQREVNGKAKMPIGKWTDLQLTADGKWIAKPFFDEQDPDGADAKRKWDLGILNAASIHGEIIELSEDPALMHPGQIFPTVTKLILDEISITDKGSNKNCVRLSYQGRTISLSSDPTKNHEELQTLFQNKNDRSMKKVIAKLNSTKFGISLLESAPEAEVETAVDKVLGKYAELSQKNTELESANAALTTENSTLKQKLQDAEVKAVDDKATVLVEAALSSGKIVAAQKPQFIALAKADYNNTKAILDGMPAHISLSGQINKNGGASDNKSYLALSKEDQAKKYDELFQGEKLAALKASDPDVFAALHEAKYGKKPTL
jgi:regulator of replication initiation timing